MQKQMSASQFKFWIKTLFVKSGQTKLKKIVILVDILALIAHSLFSSKVYFEYYTYFVILTNLQL